MIVILHQYTQHTITFTFICAAFSSSAAGTRNFRIWPPRWGSLRLTLPWCSSEWNRPVSFSWFWGSSSGGKGSSRCGRWWWAGTLKVTLGSECWSRSNRAAESFLLFPYLQSALYFSCASASLVCWSFPCPPKPSSEYPPQSVQPFFPPPLPSASASTPSSAFMLPNGTHRQHCYRTNVLHISIITLSLVGLRPRHHFTFLRRRRYFSILTIIEFLVFILLLIPLFLLWILFENIKFLFAPLLLTHFINLLCNRIIVNKITTQSPKKSSN